MSLGFVDRADLAALVVAAVRADLVRRLRLTALRTRARPARDSTRRGCAAWPCASWNGGVWDSARLVLLLSVQQFLQRRKPADRPIRPHPHVGAIQIRAALGAQIPGTTPRTTASSATPAETARAASPSRPTFPRDRRTSSDRLHRSHAPRLLGILHLRHVSQLEPRIDRDSISSRQRPHSSSSRVTARPVTRKTSSRSPLHVHRKLDRRRHAVILVLRVKSRGLKRPLEVLPLAVKPAEIEEHGIRRPYGRAQTPDYS